MSDNKYIIKSFLSSQLGVFISTISTNFLEVIKNRQISNYIVCYKNNCYGSNFKNNFKSTNKKYYSKINYCNHNKSIINEFKYLLNTIGINTFSIGLKNILQSSFLRAGIFLPTYEFTKNHLKNSNYSRNTKTILPIFLSRSLATIVTYYLEFKITLKQSKNTFMNNKFNIKAFIPFYSRELIYSLIYWSIFENYKVYNKNYKDNIYNNFFIGFFIGGLSGILTYPIEFKKVYTILCKKNSLTEIINKNGYNILSIGSMARLLKSSLGNGLFLSSYFFSFNEMKKF